MKELLGKKILGLSINEDQSILAFKTDYGFIAYEALGDCCSETGFADINGVESLIGAVIESVDRVDMEGYNIEDGRTRQEYDIAYGFKLKTNKGWIDIVFRNSSNGYYGGDIGLFERDIENLNLVEILDDWQA